MQVICHGIPDQRPLEDGDIVNVDVTAYYKGYHGDLNETFVVGTVADEFRNLIKVTAEVSWPGAWGILFSAAIADNCKWTESCSLSREYAVPCCLQSYCHLHLCSDVC